MTEETEERKYIGYDGEFWYWRSERTTTNDIPLATIEEEDGRFASDVNMYWTWNEIEIWFSVFGDQFPDLTFMDIEEEKLIRSMMEL